jgi:predicted RNA-binding Zn-ribbon protein involved in translation (DUF1610 family)
MKTLKNNTANLDNSELMEVEKMIDFKCPHCGEDICDNQLTIRKYCETVSLICDMFKNLFGDQPMTALEMIAAFEQPISIFKDADSSLLDCLVDDFAKTFENFKPNKFEKSFLTNKKPTLTDIKEHSNIPRHSPLRHFIFCIKVREKWGNKESLLH